MLDFQLQWSKKDSLSQPFSQLPEVEDSSYPGNTTNQDTSVVMGALGLTALLLRDIL